MPIKLYLLIIIGLILFVYIISFCIKDIIRMHKQDVAMRNRKEIILDIGQRDWAMVAQKAEDRIKELGGEITGLAWINATITALMPEEGIEALKEFGTVSFTNKLHKK